jgi:hypothetical protein
LDCGGKRSATPLSARTERVVESKSIAHPKAVSPLRFATAVQNDLRHCGNRGES